MSLMMKAISKSDTIGTISGALCLIHCLATPFLFFAQATITTNHNLPWWWGILDVIFITISFFAVLWSAQKMTQTWMRFSLLGFWIFLAFLTLNEKLHIWHLPELLVYIPALALIGLHIYNKNYCSCKGDNCCLNE